MKLEPEDEEAEAFVVSDEIQELWDQLMEGPTISTDEIEAEARSRGVDLYELGKMLHG